MSTLGAPRAIIRCQEPQTSPGLLYLVTCGEAKHHTISLHELGNVGGVARTFRLSPEECSFIMLQIFMIFWVHEICVAVSQMCLASAVRLVLHALGGQLKAWRALLPAVPRLLRGDSLPGRSLWRCCG